ncbi:MAG: TadE/TadG family type IV pilus assembly protein [Vicinamibacteraceae bacterium]
MVRLPARVRSQSGAELVEFALVLPILLLVFGGIVDFGLLLQRQQVITNAAREGARIAVLPGYTSGDVQARVTQFVREGINSDSAAPVTSVATVTLTPGAGPAFQAARVQVTLADSFLVLGPIVSLAGGTGSFGTIALSATTTMRLETVSSGS